MTGKPADGWKDVLVRYAAGYGKTLTYAAIGCVVCLVLGVAIGLWVGIEWQQGRTAQRDVKALNRDIAQAMDAVRQAQGAAAQISIDTQAAGAAVSAHSKALSDDLQDNLQAASTASAMLEAAIAADPAAACRAGADFMRAWNTANRGDTRGAAGAGEPGAAGGAGPGPAVPGGAAAGGRPEPGRPGPQPSARDADLPRLPRPARPAGRRRARARADRGRTHRAGAPGTAARQLTGAE